MPQYALVQNGLIIEIDAATFPVAPPMAWTDDISAVSPAPHVGWSAIQTNGTWSYTAPAAPPAPTPAQQAAATYAALIAAGLTITSTGTPAVNGTYGVQDSNQANFTSTETAIQSGIVTFPITWLLANSAPVSIPSAAIFLEIAGAAYKFVDAADLAQATAAAGGTATWPSASVTIP